jgi:hypothetical protein
MIDPVSLQMIRDIVAIFGVIAGFTYYVMTVRNQNKARQAQLLMDLYESYRSTESRRQSLEIQSWEWKDPNEFFEKYSQYVNPDAWATWEAKASFFNGIGILLKRNLIDIELLDELLTSSVNRHWNMLGMGIILAEWRERLPERRQAQEWKYGSVYSVQEDSMMITPFHGFDFLYHSLMEYRKAHPLDI